MRYKLQALSIFEFGQRTDLQGRPHQEDCLAPSAEALGEKDRLFVLCDGMGGHEAGETASATVCEAIAATVKASKAWQKEERMPDSVLREAVGAAYDALDHLSFSSEGRKPGTTMTLLALHRDGATIAHLGDSRVYHIRPGARQKRQKSYSVHATIPWLTN